MKEFKYWTKQDIFKEFGLEKTESCQVLKGWIDNLEEELTTEENIFLEQQRKQLVKYIEIWNERELAINFIGRLIAEIDFYTDNANFFYGRNLVSKIEGKKIEGSVFGMFAEGKYAPNQPYFCLHQKNYELDFNNDGVAQLIMIMYAAQGFSNYQFPMYGAYVNERSWFFMTLTDKGYYKSEVFTATKKDELLQIYLILKRLKNIVNKLAIIHQNLVSINKMTNLSIFSTSSN
ncbi:MAG: hypothetical protein AAGG68_06830 [Bacteroidota bacterium]